MITANLAPTWEHFRAVQARSLVLMKHAQIVTTSPDVSPVTTGTLPPKPAPRNAQVLINILVLAPAIPAEAAQPVVENIRLVLAPADMLGTEVLVPSKTLA